MKYNVKRHKWIIGCFRKPLGLQRQLGMIAEYALNIKENKPWRNKKHKELWWKAFERGRNFR